MKGEQKGVPVQFIGWVALFAFIAGAMIPYVLYEKKLDLERLKYQSKVEELQWEFDEKEMAIQQEATDQYKQAHQECIRDKAALAQQAAADLKECQQTMDGMQDSYAALLAAKDDCVKCPKCPKPKISMNASTKLARCRELVAWYDAELKKIADAGGCPTCEN
jgi:seryl-tRNA synthetase